MGKSVSKIRHIQEMNEKIEKTFLNENKNIIKENWWDRVIANARGFGSRFATLGSNLGSKVRKDSTLEAAKVRIDSRAGRLYKELEGFQDDLRSLFDKKDKLKVQGKIEKAYQDADSNREREVIKGDQDSLGEFREDISQLISNAESLKNFLSAFTNKY